MTTLDRPTDLLNTQRNSFGFQFPNNDFILGTKGDVHTFFLVINDLIQMKTIKDDYSTISYDLYRTFVDRNNLVEFKEQWPALQLALGEVAPDQLDWSEYPNNKTVGEFDYQKNLLDLSKSSIAEVFSRYFFAMSNACEWMDIALAREKNKYTPRIIVSPTEIRSSRKFQLLDDETLLAAADDPLWLREPG